MPANQYDDPLNFLPSSTDGETITSDPLDSLPTSTTKAPMDIVNYSPTGDDGESTPLAARCPISWSSIVDEIRLDPATPFPSVWKSRSDFVRWAIWRGILDAQKFRIEFKNADDPDDALDPIVSAHIFSERTLGMLNARTELITRGKRQTDKLAEAVDIMFQAQELVEANKLIEYYMMGVKTMKDQFWRGFYTRLLLENATLKGHVATLINQDLLQDSYLIQYATSLGIVDHPIEVPEEYFEEYPELQEII